jgi:hypothetical protein
MIQHNLQVCHNRSGGTIGNLYAVRAKANIIKTAIGVAGNQCASRIIQTILPIGKICLTSNSRHKINH